MKHFVLASLLLFPGQSWCQEVEPGPEARTYPFITTRGQLQLQYDDGARGTASGDDPAVILNGISVAPGVDRLNIRRARVVTTLHLSEILQMVNETNFDTRTNRVSVLDIYLRAQLNENWDMRAGMFKVPFGWEGLRSSRSTNTIEMSDVTRALSNFRDSGLAFTYQDEKLEWSQAFVQGQGGVWTDLNGGKDWVTRVTYQAAPYLRLGGSMHFGSYRPMGSTVNLPVRRYGGEFQFSHEGWKVEGEALWSDGFNYFSQANTTAHGFYLCLVRQLDERNDLVLHFDQFDPDLTGRDLEAANNATNRRERLVLGWNYYFKRSPEHRLMVNYEFARETEGPRVSNNGLRVRYQFSW